MDWGDGAVTTVADMEAAKATVHAEIEGLVEALEADAFTVALSDDINNFRTRVWPRYKKNRTGERPVNLYPIKEYMMETFGAKRIPLLEADDVCGIMATNPKGERRIIVSDDKDMQTIPGEWYAPRIGFVRTVTPEEAWRFHLKQTLMGDATDGYPGLYRVGPAKADKILEKAETPAEGWRAVVEAYEAKGETEEQALTMARLAFILQRQYLGPNQTPILWNPPAP